MSTENVCPAFTFLQHVFQTTLPPLFIQATKTWTVYDIWVMTCSYSSNSLIDMQSINRARCFNDFVTMRRQGPSKETSFYGFSDREPDDHVDCIRGGFWPSEASKLRDRPRHFGWPTQDDLLSITDFGFHLVAIGHPHSYTKDVEWWIPFSIAEQTLVWSFNHVQMQCYDLMKIILKQFINVTCSSEN